MSEDLSSLARSVVELASRAGEGILEVYSTDFAVEEKADASPLTQADLASERIILSGLTELTPDLPVLSEETGDVPYAERSGWRRSWLVDPLDGTKEFVKRNGEFTVNIALVEGGVPILGVVHAPVLGVSYAAARGWGAYRIDSAGERAISIEEPSHGGEMRVVMSRSHANEATARFVEALENDYRVEAVSRGSALKICLVAEGTAHLYPRLGPTMEWDVGAAQCVLEQAGGELVTMDGLPMRYNREQLLNGEFLACFGKSARWLQLLAPDATREG